jgi:hypothetical protein
MASFESVEQNAYELVEQARVLLEAAGQPGSSDGVDRALASSEEALQLLSATWYRLAADASTAVAEGDPALSREQEVGLLATLHDVAGAFARCARDCRRARPTAGRLLEKRAQRETDVLVHAVAR